MISTGNDIVALKAINIARTKQPNFYSKIICETERDLYDKQVAGKLPFGNFVWLLWSVKESAYKYLQRISPELVFSPVKIVIGSLHLPRQSQHENLEGAGFNEQSVYSGTVEFRAFKLYFRSIISSDFIFSVVNGGDDFENTGWGIRHIDQDDTAYQSKAVRGFLLGRLNDLVPGNELHIGKTPQGCPVLSNGTTEMNIPVSLAHHDHYIAYSFQLK